MRMHKLRGIFGGAEEDHKQKHSWGPKIDAQPCDGGGEQIEEKAVLSLHAGWATYEAFWEGRERSLDAMVFFI